MEQEFDDELVKEIVRRLVYFLDKETFTYGGNESLTIDGNVKFVDLEKAIKHPIPINKWECKVG